MHSTLVCNIVFTASLIIVNEALVNVDAAASFSKSTNRRIQPKGMPIHNDDCFRAKTKRYVPYYSKLAMSNSIHPESDDRPLPSASIFTNSRRDFLSQQQVSAVMLSSLILGSGSVDASSDSPNILRKTIVITGANSGIGLEACKQLSQLGHTLVLACRSLDKAQKAVEAISSSAEAIGRLIPAECDLASLSSIQSFAEGLKSTLDAEKPIDTLCLNAGVARNTEAKDCARTKDGFELTVGTNHFGHFYLNHLLLPMMAKDGRIVVTASSVHDPKSPGGAQGIPATLGTLDGLRLQGRDCEMLDGNPFNADKAYKDSKLCNVLFTRELQRRLGNDLTTKGISVNCFSPGLIVGTGLFRDQNPFFIKLFDIAATDLFKVGETIEWGGASLAYMTTLSTKGLFYNSPPGSSKYGNAAFGRDFVPMPVSNEGHDDVKAATLWELSSKVLGINA